MNATVRSEKVRTDANLSDVPVDARVARSRAAVLCAATELLVAGGPSAVTVDAIVARSGVAKSTIYRHWAARDDILFDVIEHCAPQFETPDPALGLEDGLRHLMHQVVRHLTHPEWGRIMPALMMLRSHQDGIADLDDRLCERREHAFDGVLRQGISDGALPADLDLDDAIADLIGPLLYAHVVRNPPLDDALAERVLRRFLAANAPR